MITLLRTDQPGYRVVERIISEPDLRFRRTVAGYARRYLLDPDDLYQAASERLLRQGTVVPDHEGLRGWLDRCVRYTAMDLIKDQARQPVAMSPADLPEPATVAALDTIGWEQWLTQRLGRALSADELRAILALAHDPDIDLRELARLVDKSYAGARQLKSRAMAKLGRLIGLTTVELAAYQGWRKGEEIADAAQRLGVDPTGVHRLRRAAAVKIEQFLAPEAAAAAASGCRTPCQV